jgi:hypothetical protein
VIGRQIDSGVCISLVLTGVVELIMSSVADNLSLLLQPTVRCDLI